MIWLISKVVTQKCNSSRNLQRSKLVWAVFENVALSETLDVCKFWTNLVLLPEAAVCRECLKNVGIFNGKYFCWSLFNNVPGLQACNFINKKLQHRCFPVNIAKLFKSNFFYRTLLVIASVLWTITMLSFNRALSNLRTMDDFNFTNFLSDRDMDALRKVPVIVSFAKLFQTTTSRKCYWYLSLVIMPICFSISFLHTR